MKLFGTFLVRLVTTGSVAQHPAAGSQCQSALESRVGNRDTKVMQSASRFSMKSSNSTGADATTTRPSSTTSARARVLASTLVAVTSNRRDNAVTKSSTMAGTWAVTFWLSPGSFSPASSLGEYSG